MLAALLAQNACAMGARGMLRAQSERVSDMLVPRRQGRWGAVDGCGGGVSLRLGTARRLWSRAGYEHDLCRQA